MEAYFRDDFDYEGYETEERPRDTKIDQAKKELSAFFEQHPLEVFYERQLEVLFEHKFFHWITSRALRELREEEHIASDLVPLTGDVSIRLYRPTTHRYWKRQARQMIEIVRAFSVPDFTRALGQHGELMFDAALPTVGFMPRGSDVRVHAGKSWTTTGHDLDRLFERDGVTYGIEVKNTLPYIPLKELQTKLQMCEYFGIKPMFIVRMAPKSYVETVRQRGGFTLIFKYQLYPHGYGELAAKVRTYLRLPVDSPTRIAQGTMDRLLNWHLRTITQRNP